MPTTTRARSNVGGAGANNPGFSDNDVKPPPKKRTPAPEKSALPTVKRSRGSTSNDDPPSEEPRKASVKTGKRKLVDSDGSADDTGKPPTNATPSRRHETGTAASATLSNSNKNLAGVSPREVRMNGYSGLEKMASNDFIKVLAKSGVTAKKASMQGFSQLKVEETERRAAVRWKTITESKPAGVMIPDTATLGICSVFAVKASTEGRFKDKAKEFLGNNMGSNDLKSSFAFILHHDSKGDPQAALIGYPLEDGPLHCYDSLKADEANQILMELNKVKGSIHWLLEKPRTKFRGPTKRQRLDSQSDVSTSDSSDSSSG